MNKENKPCNFEQKHTRFDCMNPHSQHYGGSCTAECRWHTPLAPPTKQEPGKYSDWVPGEMLKQAVDENVRLSDEVDRLRMFLGKPTCVNCPLEQADQTERVVEEAAINAFALLSPEQKARIRASLKTAGARLTEWREKMLGEGL